MISNSLDDETKRASERASETEVWKIPRFSSFFLSTPIDLTSVREGYLGYPKVNRSWIFTSTSTLTILFSFPSFVF